MDESGKSPPEAKLPGPQFFCLGGVAISPGATTKYIQDADAIKTEFFGRVDFSFHEPFMREHYGDSRSGADYSFSGNEGRQVEFDEAITKLIADTEFLSFGVAIRKTAYESEFLATGIDPYLPTDIYALAIQLLLERYVDALAHAPGKQTGAVSFEGQGSKENAYHQLEYARTLLDGTQWVPASAFQRYLLPGLQFESKGKSSPVELADFFTRDLYEWVRSVCTYEPPHFDLYCKKVYVRGDGRMGQFGIKVFPDLPESDLIEMHRVRYGAVR